MMPSFDEQLKRSLPRCEPPGGLHGAIMDAVRSARMEPATRSGALLSSTRASAVGCALVLLAATGGYLYLDARRDSASENPAQSLPALAGADTALTVGDHLSRSAPAAIVAPMERELELINRDLESTRQLLLASLP